LSVNHFMYFCMEKQADLKNYRLSKTVTFL
jgi:hypothetical protein